MPTTIKQQAPPQPPASGYITYIHQCTPHGKAYTESRQQQRSETSWYLQNTQLTRLLTLGTTRHKSAPYKKNKHETIQRFRRRSLLFQKMSNQVLSYTRSRGGKRTTENTRAPRYNPAFARDIEQANVKHSLQPSKAADTKRRRVRKRTKYGT